MFPFCKFIPNTTYFYFLFISDITVNKTIRINHSTILNTNKCNLNLLKPLTFRSGGQKQWDKGAIEVYTCWRMRHRKCDQTSPDLSIACADASAYRISTSQTSLKNHKQEANTSFLSGKFLLLYWPGAFINEGRSRTNSESLFHHSEGIKKQKATSWYGQRKICHR